MSDTKSCRSGFNPTCRAKARPTLIPERAAIVGCGDEGTASFAIDAVRKLTTSYGTQKIHCAVCSELPWLYFRLIGATASHQLVTEGRNNQRALRRMFGCFHPVQCASLIAPYRISQKPSHQLSWPHYIELPKVDDESERAA